MGNWLWCSHAASGERLAAAARDGDMAEAKMLLDHNPGLASYSSAFTALNSPLHFAASKGHAQIVMLLLESGADANSKNFYGQTALMQACRQGHWEVVLFLLLFNTDVTRAESLGGKTALHFAAGAGHVRCIRLLVSDFDPSAPYAANVLPMNIDKHGDSSGSRRKGSFCSSSRSRCDISALSKFVNKVANGGVTALHLATLNGHSDCVQLLLDLHANVSAATAHYGSTSKMIGAGSTPLHFAACGGNLKCCQVLLARGASRLTANYDGFLPVDLAKIWGHQFLVPLLSPHSDLKIPTFPPSSYLCLPLISVLNIARECRLKSLTASADENDLCAVCLENACSVAAKECAHELCVKCALYLCSTSNITYQVDGPPGSLPCPLCRNGIVSFIKVGPDALMKSVELNQYESNLCRSEGHDPTLTCRSHFCRSCIVSLSVSSSQIV